MKILLKLLVIAMVGFVPSLGRTDERLATFKGGIGADGVSAAPGTGTVATSVIRNIVRGVQPPNQLWRIAALRAEVKADGHIKVDGRGLVFAGGDTIGTALVVTPTGGTATLNVFATLICETVAPFVERNTGPVPLAADGDFRIDDVLSPRPPASCATPVLLIRNEGNRNWFAAGIQKFDGDDEADASALRARIEGTVADRTDPAHVRGKNGEADPYAPARRRAALNGIPRR